jgi:hypothetical protein
MKLFFESKVGDTIVDDAFTEKTDGFRPTNDSCASHSSSNVEKKLRQAQDEDKENTNRDIERGSVPFEKSTQLVEKEPELQEPNLVDWEGPDDPDNPMNWPRGRKVLVTASISMITLLTYAVRVRSVPHY